MDKVRAYHGLELLEHYNGKLVTIATNGRRIFFVGLADYHGIRCVKVDIHTPEGHVSTLGVFWSLPPRPNWDLRTLDGRAVDFS